MKSFLFNILFTAVAGAVFSVTAQAESDCQKRLLQKGLKITPTSERGTVDAVLFSPSTQTVLLQHWPHLKGTEPLLMDCQVAEGLDRISPALKEHGVVMLLGVRSYKYRCIAPAKDPPKCTGSSLSLHASARALDIGGFMDQEGVKYWFEHDWIVDHSGRPTCGAEFSGKNGFLHRVVCAIFETGVFTQHLTPDYNQDHRSHMHLDFSGQERFIR